MWGGWCDDVQGLLLLPLMLLLSLLPLLLSRGYCYCSPRHPMPHLSCYYCYCCRPPMPHLSSCCSYFRPSTRYPFTHSLTHTLIHSLTHPLKYPFTLSSTHSCTLSPTQPLSHSLTRSLSHLLSHSLIHSLAHSPTCPLTHTPTYSRAWPTPPPRPPAVFHSLVAGHSMYDSCSCGDLTGSGRDLAWLSGV